MEPSAVSPEILKQLEELVRDGRPHSIVGPEGERVELPAALNEMLAFVVGAMKREQGILLIPEDASLTTESAARLLGMSRPYLSRLLDSGKIPYHRVGTHRRLLLRDVRAFQSTRDAERRTRLDALTRAVDEAGLYDRS